MVRLDDQHGRFWMEEGHNRWSDTIDDGWKFSVEEEARRAAAQARADATKRPDWFPKIKVVRFT